MTVTIASGHRIGYYLSQVAKGRENYYTRAVEQGEPAGVWNGDGARDLGLDGEVDPRDLEAVFSHLVDPRDPGFRNREAWPAAAKLGKPPRKYKSPDELFAAALAREPGASRERQEELRADAKRRARSAVGYLDATFEVPKSVSVLHASYRAQEAAAKRAGDHAAAADWAAKAEQVEASIWKANQAMLEVLQREGGYSRVGYHGRRKTGQESVGRYVDAHRFVVASFLQHTSRNEDPHIHIHNPILNRVQCPDGEWRTLDGRALYRARPAAAAAAERTLYEDLTRTRGVQFRMRPDGRSREIVGIGQDTRDLFSTRTQAINKMMSVAVEVFEEVKGRKPNALELSRINAQAWKKTRPNKLRNAPSAEERLLRWADTLRGQLDKELGDIANNVDGKVRDVEAAKEVFTPNAVIAAAIADVQATKSAWTRYDLIRAIDAHLPDCLGGLDAQHVIDLQEELADRALSPTPEQRAELAALGPEAEVVQVSVPDVVPAPDELRRDDGRSLWEAHGAEKYSTKAHLSREDQLVAGAQRDARAPRLESWQVDRVVDQLNARLEAEAGGQLGEDQEAALRGILSSGAYGEVLIGPAGTGKSFVLGALTEAWQDEVHGRVFGLATAQKAVDVLRDEGVGSAYNIADWLKRQERLGAGRGQGDDDAAALRPGDLIVVDETGMAGTKDLAEIERYARGAGAKLVYTGDDHQLGAVGAGGALRLLTQTANVYELGTVRRFNERWERDASLRLRDGDPAALEEYQQHGRIVDAGTLDDAQRTIADAYVADTLAGKNSIVVVGSNELAADLSQQIRNRLIELGRVESLGVPLADENVAGAGDVIQTRRNDRGIRDLVGRWVVNRDTYRVVARNDDGSLTVRRNLGKDRRSGQWRVGPEMRLSAAYLAKHATLAYATTAHGAQGATVERAYTLVDEGTELPVLYVGLTRGSEYNVAHVVTEHGDELATELAERGNIQPEPVAEQTQDRTVPEQVLGGILDGYEPEMSATETMREAFEFAESSGRLGPIRDDTTTEAARTRYQVILGDLTADGVLTEDQLGAILADPAQGALYRAVRLAELAGGDPDRVLRTAVGSRSLENVDSIAKVLHHRVSTAWGKREPVGETYRDRTPDDSRAGAWGQYAGELAEAMDQRVDVLGERLAEQPPMWARTTLGPVPDDPIGRAEWVRRAGTVEAYREQYGRGTDTDALGPCPQRGVPEARATWYAAWRALGRPVEEREAATKAEVELRADLDRWRREQEWAPDYVADELRSASVAAREYQQRAVLLSAEAQVTADPQRRAELEDLAADYDELAGALGEAREQLDRVHAERGAWYLETTPAREAAAEARRELEARGLDPDGELGQRLTAQALLRRSLSGEPDDSPRARYATVAGELTDEGVLDTQQLAELLGDDAQGALWTAMERAEAAGYNTTSLLREAVAERALETDPESPAQSIGAVLQWRIERRMENTSPDQYAEPEPADIDQAAAEDADQAEPATVDQHVQQDAADTDELDTPAYDETDRAGELAGDDELDVDQRAEQQDAAEAGAEDVDAAGETEDQDLAAAAASDGAEDVDEQTAGESTGDELAAAVRAAAAVDADERDAADAEDTELDVDQDQPDRDATVQTEATQPAAETDEDHDLAADQDAAADVDARSEQEPDRTDAQQGQANRGADTADVEPGHELGDEQAAEADEPTRDVEAADQPERASWPEDVRQPGSIRDAVRQAQRAAAERQRRDAERAAEAERYAEPPAPTADRSAEHDGPSLSL
jgi:AAA domain-containing protein/TrwC relaxase